jgi:trigger factor
VSYKITEKTSSEVRLEIDVDKVKLKKATDLVVGELGKSVKIDGFRPGKAPLYLIEKEVGKDQFWAEVIDKVVPEAFYEAVISEKINAIAQPQIKIMQFVPGEKLVFEAQVAIMPEMKNLEYKGHGIKEKHEPVSDKEKKDALEGLLKRYTEEKEVDRAAKIGDKVEIDFDGTMKGLPFDGGKSENHPVILGSNMLIPGFEDKVVGHKAGDEFEFEIIFPKDYHAGNLAGQKTNFKVKLNKVYEMVVPKATDEWAQKLGMKTLKDLEEELGKQLEFEKGMADKRKTEEEILGKIITAGKIEAPQTLVTEETHRMVHEAEHNLASSGLTVEKFLEMSKKTLPDLELEMKPEAERRVKTGMLLGEVARLENISSSEKEVDEEIDRLVGMSGPDVSKEDVRASYDTPDRRREIGNTIIIRKVMEKLWEYNVSK